MEKYNFTPIGFISCREQYKYEQPRQGTMQSADSLIELSTGQNFEQALKDLEGFDYIWLIFVFHQNSGWKPLVNPPRLTDGRKVGLFATRSPYRPNPVGMSCVRLLKIDGLKLFIQGSDLLDGTPVLDIKPYINYCDSFPDAKQGWLSDETLAEYQLVYQEDVNQKISWLEENSNLSIRSFLETQLTKEPLSARRKRIKQIDDTTSQLSYRTWRIDFKLEEYQIVICDLYSGYSADDLLSEEDKYHDKSLHRRFLEEF